MTTNVSSVTSLVSNQRTTIEVPKEYRTIQEAIDAASRGNIIYVSKGTYSEHLSITKDDLRLIGEDTDTTIIDGNHTGTVVSVSANNVTITGFTIRRSGADGEGFYLDNSNDTLIANNTCDNCNVGISLTHSCNNKIIGNTVSNNGEGIVLAVKSTHNVISSNTVTNNSQGINIRAYAINNTISRNTIIDNFYSGIYVSLSSNNVITRNTIVQHLHGIYLYGSFATRNILAENTVANNSHGVHVFQSSGNIFYHNNFINNINQVYFDYSLTNLWDNGTEGNYWSDYDGKDADDNGIGDVPYVIDANNRDNHPLMHLWGYNKGYTEGPTYFKEIILAVVSILAAAGIATYLLKIKRKSN